MPDTVHILHASHPGWERSLEGAAHDFFQTAVHHAAWESAGRKQAFIAVLQEGDRSVAWPYLLRPIETSAGTPTGVFDITSVDGYAGPVYRGCTAGDAFATHAIAEIFRAWRDLGVVSVFTRFHPLLENQIGIDGLRFQGHTVSIDLGVSDECAGSLYRDNHRRQIRKAFKSGLTVQVEQSREAFLAFVRLYHQTMRRNHADSHYFFSEDFLAHLRDDLAGGGTIHTARLNDRIVGAVLITEFQGIVQYLLGGVDEDMQQVSPSRRCWKAFGYGAEPRQSYAAPGRRPRLQ